MTSSRGCHDDTENTTITRIGTLIYAAVNGSRLTLTNFLTTTLWWQGTAGNNRVLRNRQHATKPSRELLHRALWFIGANGSVQDRFWYEGGSWSGFELAAAGSASRTAPLAALSRQTNTMELWFAASDGSLSDQYWYEDQVYDCAFCNDGTCQCAILKESPPLK